MVLVTIILREEQFAHLYRDDKNIQREEEQHEQKETKLPSHQLLDVLSTFVNRLKHFDEHQEGEEQAGSGGREQRRRVEDVVQRNVSASQVYYHAI